MHKTNISITRIASSNINIEGAMRWIRQELGFDDYELPELDLAAGITPAALIVMMAAKRCYNAFDVGVGNLNLTRVRSELPEYLDNILKSGHGSVLEHVTFTYAIEGITRVCSAELNRHRAGVAVSEGSMRYIRTDDLGYRVPSIFEQDNTVLQDLMPNMDPDNLAHLKDASVTLLEEEFASMELTLKRLSYIWDMDGDSMSFVAKKHLTSAFRRIIGMGVATGGVWTFNVRALRHILALRGNKTHAEEEIFELADLLMNDVIKDEPLLFGDFEQGLDGVWKPKYPKV